MGLTHYLRIAAIPDHVEPASLQGFAINIRRSMLFPAQSSIEAALLWVTHLGYARRGVDGHVLSVWFDPALGFFMFSSSPHLRSHSTYGLFIGKNRTELYLLCCYLGFI